MGAFYYVKSGGTAAGTNNGREPTTPRTSSFAAMGAANYYATVTEAMSAPTTPVAGDVICVSDASYYTVTTGTYCVATASGVLVTSVNDLAAKNYTKQTTDTWRSTGASGSMSLTTANGYRVEYRGIKLSSNADITLSASKSAQTTFQECTFETNGSSDDFRIGNADGARTVLYDCEFIFGANNGGWVFGQGGAQSILHRCKVTGVAQTAGLIQGSAANGGEYIQCYDCDFSIYDTYLLNIEDTSLSVVNVEMHRCRLHPDVTFLYAPISGAVDRVLITQSGSGDEVEYQYFFTTRGSTVEDETGIYRDGSQAFPSGQKISLKCTTGSTLSVHDPLTFELPSSVYADLSDGSTVLKIHLLCPDTLTDAEIFATMTYPDDTTPSVPNIRWSTTADVVEHFRTWNALPTNTEAWTGRTTENRYELAIDLDGSPGTPSVPRILITIAKPNTTIYICPSIEVS